MLFSDDNSFGEELERNEIGFEGCFSSRLALIVVVIGLVALNGNQRAEVNLQPTTTPTLSNTSTLPLTASPLVAASSEPSIIITYSNWTGPLGYDVSAHGCS